MLSKKFTISDCSNVITNMLRKKDISVDMQRTDLRRCFGLVDLTFLAISGMVGSGLYVLAGEVIRNVAGPSIVISYALAAIAAILSALCYAEFAARVPVAGSAYQFTYLSVGEFWAFLVGWNVALEHTIYVAAIAKTCSSYLDGMFGNAIKNYMETHAKMSGNFVAPYPDFLAVLLVLIFAVVLLAGVKLSSKVNIAITTINVFVITFIIITGLVLAKWEDWSHDNFFPYTFSGTMRGATILVYSYVGYEVVASATEEAVNAGRDIPLSLLIAISAVVISFVGASGALTLIVPWDHVSVNTPFPSAYAERGWNWAKYVVSIGALAAMVTCMLSVMFVIPRYLLAMARDGLLWNCFTILNPSTQVPIVSTVVVAILSAVMALLFSLSTLVEFIAIGQLMACTFVAVCVIKLRYIPNNLSRRADEFGEYLPENTKLDELKNHSSSNGHSTKEESMYTTKLDSRADEEDKKVNLNTTNGAQNGFVLPTDNSNDNLVIPSSANNTESSTLVQSSYGTIKKNVLYSPFGFLFQWTTSCAAGNPPFYSLLIAIGNALFAVIMLQFGNAFHTEWWFIILLVIFISISILSLCFISFFIQDDSIKTFKVPLVPYIPFTSVVINMVLMLKLQAITWARFSIWIAIGFVVYFAYGYQYSAAKEEPKAEENTTESQQ